MNCALLPLRLSAIFVVVSASALSPLAAQTTTSAPHRDERIPSLIQMLGQTKEPTEAAISPDGKTVAWSVETSDGSQIHLTDIANPAKDNLLRTEAEATDCSNEVPIWSPDGQWLAFESTCAAKEDKADQEQIFIWSKKTGQCRQLTHIVGEIDMPAWSPDGRSIGFLFVENATRNAGALAAMKPWNGVIGEDGIEIQRVAAVDVASGTVTQLTPASLHVYEFDWSPDSRHLAYVAANPPGENNWWVAQLYVQKADQTAQPQSILKPTEISGSLHNLQIAVPRWSPDGKQIAFIGGLMSDQGSTGGDIYLISSTGGEPQDLTPGRTSSVAFIQWLSPKLIGLAEHVGGSTHITALNVETGTDAKAVDITLPETIWANELVMSISTSKTEDVALVRTSFEQAPEVWAGPINHLRQITHLNDDLKPRWGKTEDINWSNEGFNVQGWLLYPADYDPAKKYPLLVYIHGGPSAAVTPRWPSASYGGVPFSALGYFVFMPNARGSFGKGEKFTQANVKDFGYGDLRDTLAGMDFLEAHFPIDKSREGITGWSYGGFTTMFAVTQTARFKAAVAGAGISDWKSYYGENSIDQWMIPFFGKSVYDDPAIYAKSSAINYIKNVKAPTLLVVGDRDGECPAPQSFEFWHALRAEGVKTQLVVYPDEGHHFVNPDHTRDVLERALRWFETEMP
ncbi:S9 family peptidase [Edaphobacter dinghuensis]|uniref:Peptidase S9 n=1 Tax=Edaphobacter dinghuensis TaxID=1560005 RepID=A0A917H8N6_9BACT|nr:S9 family peptidase [Edaphobacter dinghuensis]GGG70817.1 peptidase S9 [Edaphobacter dinghuensis]